MNKPSRKQILSYLSKHLDDARFAHTLRVEETALELGKQFDGNLEALSLAALLHDACKQMPEDEQLSLGSRYTSWVDLENQEMVLRHSMAAAVLARDYFNIQDESILQAIAWHPFGYYTMDLTGKLIFMADYIEPGRQFKQAEYAKKLINDDLNEAVIYQMSQTLSFLADQQKPLSPLSVKVYHHWIKKENKL